MKTPTSLKSPLAVARRLLAGVPQAELDDASFLPWLIVDGASSLSRTLTPAAQVAELNSRLVELSKPPRRFGYTNLDDDGKPLDAGGKLLVPIPDGITATDVAAALTRSQNGVLANPTLAPKPSEVPPPEPDLLRDALTTGMMKVGLQRAESLWPDATGEPLPSDVRAKVATHWAERDRPALEHGAEASHMLAQSSPEVPSLEGSLFGAGHTFAEVFPLPIDASADEFDGGISLESELSRSDATERNPSSAAPPVSSLASSHAPPPSQAPPSPPPQKAVAAPLAVVAGIVKDWPRREDGEDDDRYQNRLSYIIQMSSHPVTVAGPNGPETKTVEQPLVTNMASKFATVMATRLKLSSPWSIAMPAKPALTVNPTTLLPTIVIDGSATFRPGAEQKMLREDRAMAQFGFARYKFEFANSPAKGSLVVIAAFVLVRGDDVDTMMATGLMRLQDFGYEAADLRVLTPAIFGYGMIVLEVNEAWLKETAAGLATLGVTVALTGAVDAVIAVDDDPGEY